MVLRLTLQYIGLLVSLKLFYGFTTDSAVYRVVGKSETLLWFYADSAVYRVMGKCDTLLWFYE